MVAFGLIKWDLSPRPLSRPPPGSRHGKARSPSALGHELGHTIHVFKKPHFTSPNAACC